MAGAVVDLWHGGLPVLFCVCCALLWVHLVCFRNYSTLLAIGLKGLPFAILKLVAYPFNICLVGFSSRASERQMPGIIRPPPKAGRAKTNSQNDSSVAEAVRSAL